MDKGDCYILTVAPRSRVTPDCLRFMPLSISSGDAAKSPSRRGGRVVEGAALEMLYRGNSIEGSNPSLSVAHAA